MKKDLSYYEFVALVIPSVVMLFSMNYILVLQGNGALFDFSNIGESIIFLCFSYALGHIIQGIGNYFEKIVWKYYGGMPTKWLLKPNRFQKRLLDSNISDKVKAKINADYGEINDETDYGLLIYNKLFQKKLTERIDIFNGNYSLLRGLSITFITLSVFLFTNCDYKLGLICSGCFFISLKRMIRFGEYYAKEIYRAYINQENQTQ
jgi:hypothetical protein